MTFRTRHMYGKDWLPLKAADDDWIREWNSVISDEWLAEKVDRARNIKEHADYLVKFAPEILFEPKLHSGMFDIGPGTGTLIEICRKLGYDSRGVDRQRESSGTMGEPYRNACQLMWSRQDITVYEFGRGFWECEYAGYGLREESVSFVNMRGAIEQTYDEFINSGSWPEIGRSQKLMWSINDQLLHRIRILLSYWHSALRQHGLFLIYCNGTQNHADFEKMLISAADAIGFGVDVPHKRLIRMKKL